HLRLRGIGQAVEQRLGRHQEARSADAALQSCVLEKFSLQGVQLLAVGETLDRDDLASLRLDPEDEAGADHATVEDDAARAAVAGRAALLGPGQLEAVAQHLEERLARLAEELGPLAVDGGMNMGLVCHGVPSRFLQWSPEARRAASATTRRVSTP